jgi:hypothetical protein
MGRRPLAGRDKKIIQGHRRDEFFAKMRRKGGVPRMPREGATVREAPEDSQAGTALDEGKAAAAAEAVAEAETAAPAEEEAEAASASPRAQRSA